MAPRHARLALVAALSLAAAAPSAHAGPIKRIPFDCRASVRHFGDYPANATLLVRGVSCAHAHTLYLRMKAKGELDPERYGAFTLRDGVTKGPIRSPRVYSCTTSQRTTRRVTDTTKCHDGLGDTLKLSWWYSL
jgi:hypothetical protein